MDLKNAQTIFDVIKGMSGAELAVTAVICISSVMGASWVENRYAKMKDTQESISRTEAEIRKHKDEIIQMHVRTLELIKLQPKEVQQMITDNSKAFMENYRRMEQTK
jgi:hypothetical protein